MSNSRVLNEFKSMDVVLEDTYVTKSGKTYDYNWKSLKTRSLLISESFNRLGLYKQSCAIKECGTFLEFLQAFNDDNVSSNEFRMKLYNANFCKNRLCSLCMKRRQMKIFGQVSRVMDSVCKMGDYDFLFLTLTCPNCVGSDLSVVLDSMFRAFKKLCLLRPFKRAVIGWYRALEVNIDLEERITVDMYWGNAKRHIKSRRAYYDRLGLVVGDDNPNFLKFHPHFHMILAVRKDYFVGKDYLSQEVISKMWSECLGCPNEYRQVFIEKIVAYGENCTMRKAVSEVAKYPIKDFDILIPDREDLTDYAVNSLHHALYNRKLIGYGGILRKIYIELGLSDPIDGDLIHLDDDSPRNDIEYIVKRYLWRIGATSGYNYYLDSEFAFSPDSLE